MNPDKPRMYHEFAEWFHLLTAPEDYEEEMTYFFAAIEEALGRKPASWLELGSGGGNNAYHYRNWVKGPVVLSDRSTEMLSLSQKLNPALEHIEGDMRTLRLGRTFDVVFVHDACSYITTEHDLRWLADTAFAHCGVGGVALFCPDATAEKLVLETDHGGHDGNGRSMRYLEWDSAGPAGSFEYYTDYAYILHEEGKPPRFEYDRHVTGALPHDAWIKSLKEAGFATAVSKPFVHSEVEHAMDMFIATR